MKRLLLVSCAFLITIFSACNKENGSSDTARNSADEKYIELVDSYNKLQPHANIGSGKAFIYYGPLSSSTISSTGQGLFKSTTLEFDLSVKEEESNDLVPLKVDIGLDEAITFPELIKKARLVRLGNQLIIADLESNFQMNFFVKSSKTARNLTPSIPTIECVSLGTRTY